MAGGTPQGEALLKRPLYVYSLPAELLESLTTKSANGSRVLPTESNESQAGARDSEDDSSSPGSKSCALCQVTFQEVREQREHVKSDHHRYNLKARLRGTATLNETEFNKAIGDLDESISGSDSESNDEEESGQQTPDTTLTALLKKQAKISSPVPFDESSDSSKKGRGGRAPLLWFASPLLDINTSLGIYRALFTNEEQAEPNYLVDSLKAKQKKPHIIHRAQDTSESASNASKATADSSPEHIFLCMIGGGHFAAMVVALAPEVQKRSGIEERQARVLAHKTFHRYTTRRKQGGGQAAHDAAGGAAHSAGATLRRYNEAALENEIRQLLKSWKDMIDDAQLLFIRAVGSTNRRILYGPYEGQVLKHSDPRIRVFPFSTRRATQAELMRVFTELTRVKVSHIDEAALAAEEAEREAASKSPKSVAQIQPQKPKISKEDEAAMLHTSQIQALIRRSKVPALLSYIASNSIPHDFRFYPPNSSQNYHASTPLHLAASSNSPAVVSALMIKVRVDPTQLNDDGKPPFDLAGNRITRDAFRVARLELGEEAWDWEAAHIPSAMSKQESENREEAERKAAKEVEDKRRTEEVERLRKEETPSIGGKNRASRQTIAAIQQKTGAEKREEETRGMTPEMRMKLERERRARAAEERFRKMQSGSGA
ncbi:ankyrin repeat and zinc finger domain-containing protein 1 [Nannizzia gypsea CBS 118893]|uniref:Ankyrin repeat and zinc finger domain-containing protein 1 n=1 Tax=Arthroderma gypseum (strain ATCC MYA-4604 / CBS 118893) TaxID=535722 RepID=E4USD6_ARTGP|nr:ankyrin repeat and zinc finger domain-containing protein 1 [Nannizzia gypsea CBS 118893]EFR00503.1 ankyrin repeat and zinc finger domain-containing protein 1 [Nannizzia gypsea CBS 118893]